MQCIWSAVSAQVKKILLARADLDLQLERLFSVELKATYLSLARIESEYSVHLSSNVTLGALTRPIQFNLLSSCYSLLSEKWRAESDNGVRAAEKEAKKLNDCSALAPLLYTSIIRASALIFSISWWSSLALSRSLSLDWSWKNSSTLNSEHSFELYPSAFWAFYSFIGFLAFFACIYQTNLQPIAHQAHQLASHRSAMQYIHLGSSKCTVPWLPLIPRSQRSVSHAVICVERKSKKIRTTSTNGAKWSSSHALVSEAAHIRHASRAFLSSFKSSLSSLSSLFDSNFK